MKTIAFKELKWLPNYNAAALRIRYPELLSGAMAEWKKQVHTVESKKMPKTRTTLLTKVGTRLFVEALSSFRGGGCIHINVPYSRDSLTVILSQQNRKQRF